MLKVKEYTIYELIFDILTTILILTDLLSMYKSFVYLSFINRF